MGSRAVLALTLSVLSGCYTPPCEGDACAPDGGSFGGGTGGSIGGGSGGSMGDGGGTIDGGSFDGGPIDAGSVDAGSDAGCVPPPAGLVSWWPGEGNALDLVGPNSGTLFGGVTFVAGRVGQAFRFNGIDGFVSAPTTGMPIGASDRTIEFWVRVDQVSNDQPFFAGYGSFGSSSASYHVGSLRQGGLSYFSQWGQALFGVPLQLSTWTHVLVTTQSSVTYLYLNGAVTAAGVVPLNTSSASSFNIGRIAGTIGNTERLNGAVDEVSVYNRALTQAEITALAAAPYGKCR